MSMEDREGSIWVDGTLVPWASARFHMLSHSLHHGAAIFEGVRSYDTPKGPAIFRLADHTRRFCHSAHIINMTLPFDYETILKAQIDVVRANDLRDCYIRPIAFYGGEKMGVAATGNTVHVAIAAWPWETYHGAEAHAKGIRIKTSSFSRHHVNAVLIHAKASAHYINSSLANQEAVKAGYDDALMLDVQGFAAEGSTSNLFMIRNGRLITPDAATVLEGITRDSVISLAKDLGIEVAEKRIARDEIYCADEAFLTGTAAEIVPMRELDDRKIGSGQPGPITQRLQKLFFETVRGGNAARMGWLHPVSGRTP